VHGVDWPASPTARAPSGWRRRDRSALVYHRDGRSPGAADDGASTATASGSSSLPRAAEWRRSRRQPSLRVSMSWQP